jgi:hypothetical protein
VISWLYIKKPKKKMAFDYREITKANAQISKNSKILKRRSPKCQPNLCSAKAGHGQAKDDQDG